MNNLKSYSNSVALCTNYVRVDMDVFAMPVSSMTNKYKDKLFCDEIIYINQFKFKNKRVITH